MRARKRVVVMGGSELQQSVLGIVLESRTYHVVIASDAALEKLRTPSVFLLVEGEGCDARADRVRERFPETPVVRVALPATLAGGEWCPALLRDLAIATAAKRGPKPLFRIAKRSAAGEMARAQVMRRRVG